VWIISHKRLKDFWEQPGHANAQKPLEEWYDITDESTWKNFSDVRGTFAKVSLVGDCVVFNILSSHYRLVTRIRYRSHKVYILKVMTHEEYDDQDKWQDDCGCHVPPPGQSE